MNLARRIESLEVVAAARRQAAQAAALGEFNIWIADHWSEAERALWDRYLLSALVPDDFYIRLSMTKAEALAIMADYAPLASEERDALDLAWGRVPASLREWRDA